MRTIMISALLAATAATPALAQERAPFTGPHVEALVGYENINVPNDGEKGKSGVTYGGAAGFDFQAGGAILGIEGEVSDSSNKTRDFNVVAAGDQFRVDTGRDLYVGARIGFAARPGTLIYAKGGYTNLRLKSTYSLAGVSASEKNNLDGYRIGAGVEQKFNLFGPSGFIKAEYRYSNYKNLNDGASNIDVDLDRHQAVLGVGVRF